MAVVVIFLACHSGHDHSPDCKARWDGRHLWTFGACLLGVSVQRTVVRLYRRGRRCVIRPLLRCNRNFKNGNAKFSMAIRRPSACTIVPVLNLALLEY
jgi:hypothetical protein